MIAALSAKYGVPFVYCNSVGGNDELIFDGNSCVFNARGEPVRILPSFEEQVVGRGPRTPPPARCRRCPRNRRSFSPALVLGLRDYFAKCGFKSAVLGLSGGIDSAVTAALAVEALGAENVTGVAMPSPYSSKGSVVDALSLAENLGVKCLQVPISEPFEAFKKQFATVFAGLPEDTTEENMQARLRGMVLMSISNKFGSLLLTTGNKS